MSINELYTDEDNEVDNFYVSWSDLVTLLLVFFIYLYSISEIDVVKFLEAKQSLKGEVSLADTEESLLIKIKKTREELERMSQSINNFIGEEHLEDVVDVQAFDDRLELNLGNALLFETGSADLRGQAKQVIGRVSDLFNTTTGTIIVEGHTDDVPIKTDRFPSNWELSSARSSAVVRFMVSQKVLESRFVVLGYNQYMPLKPNTSASNRAANRRVKIILKPDVHEILKKEQANNQSTNHVNVTFKELFS